MIVTVPCYHTGCNVKGGHPVTFDVPDICGVLNCNREAKASLRQGFTYYKVCTIHAQGVIIADTKPLEEELNNHHCKTCGKKLPPGQLYSFCDDVCDRKHYLGLT